MTLFRGRYRIESDRSPGWEYWRRACYMVTIVTRYRARVLSTIENGRVRLTPIGRIVDEEWRRIAAVRENVALHAWVVMPDHVHGLIEITSSEDREAVRAPRLEPGSLGAIIGQFKSCATRRIRAAGLPWDGWLRRYHDRVVRDGEAFVRMRRYIEENPRAWRG